MKLTDEEIIKAWQGAGDKQFDDLLSIYLHRLRAVADAQLEKAKELVEKQRKEIEALRQIADDDEAVIKSMQEELGKLRAIKTGTPQLP